MKLLRELTRLQAERGFLDDECLRDLARRENVPLYRLQGLVSFYPHFRTTPPPRVCVEVCRDIACRMAGGAERIDELRRACSGYDDVDIHEVSCLGRCDNAPAASINDRPLAPHSLADVDVVQQRIETPDQIESETVEYTRRVWRCDPYAHPGEYYGTVKRLLDREDELREVCIERLQESGLRGMGGAGYPAGLKWDLVAQQEDDTKYVICNADESEPGTFKDRVILERLPHLVIEGMLLAALAIGAEQGIVYLRHEYGPEGSRLQMAIEDAYARGMLGENVAGSGRRFDLEIFVSPGGYILGEETALLEALEDKRGEPRNRPPYPGTHGLWGRPTLINNVETLALATSVIHYGSEWWVRQGAGAFAGLKIYGVAGDVVRPGVYELPMGSTIAELIERAGGLLPGKTLKAVQPGGASSSFLPADKSDTPLEFNALRDAGTILGSGAMVVIAEGHDIYDLALNITQFFRNESCGKCVPCRLGTERAVQLLEQVQEGRRQRDDLDVLPELSETLVQTSICGLGQVALGPINSVLEHFPDDVPS